MFIETGVLTVFRWYALLRLLIGGLAMAWRGNAGFEVRGGFFTNTEADAVFFAIAILLAVYVSSPRWQAALGKYYLPLGLIVATASLFLEQYGSPNPNFFWEPETFLFVLLILVAWQYESKGVLTFLVGITILDFALNQLYPPMVFSLSAGGGSPERDFAIAGQVISGQQRNFLFWGRGLARLLSFGVVGVVVTRLIRAERQKRDELAEANLKIRESASALEQLAISRERNRISRELHDTLAHTLSGLTVQFEALMAAWKDMPAKVRGLLEGMSQSTRSGLQETRRTLVNLRASPLEELGLDLAIKALADEVAQRGDFDLHSHLQSIEANLAPEVEQAYYRVAQEALENIIRHARASEAWLTLHTANGWLELEIRDNGMGIAPGLPEAEHSLGLQVMRERAELIGAEFELSSSPVGGTRVGMRVKHG